MTIDVSFHQNKFCEVLMKIEGIQALSIWGRETFWEKSGESGILNRWLRYVERLYDFDKDGEYMQDLKKKMTYCSQLILLQFLIKLILSAYELSFTLFYL